MLYRHFRNTDPPFLLLAWNESFLTRGAAVASNLATFERYALNKPYFDPEGLIVAWDESKDQIAGFCHAGFGPNAEGSAVDKTRGVICAIVVRPEYRRGGTAGELLRRAEAYLAHNGSTSILAGPIKPAKPFYVGLYGGSNAPGMLLSEPGAHPFLTKMGYLPESQTLVFRRRLQGAINIVDTRFGQLAKKYEPQVISGYSFSSWYRECCMGALEPNEFQLQSRQTGNWAARCLFWEMREYQSKYGTMPSGIIDVQVRQEFRKQGLAKYMLYQILKYLQEIQTGLVEIQVNEPDTAGIRVVRALNFEHVDTGVSFRKHVPVPGEYLG